MKRRSNKASSGLTTESLVPKPYTVVAALFLLALSAPSSARDRPFGDEFLLAYGKLESYCDAGTYFPGKESHSTEPKTFARCVHRDGRYKKTEQATTDGPSIDVEWSDGSRLFSLNRYVNYLGALEFSYNETPLEHGYAATEHLARTILDWFGIATPARSSMREYLNRFARRADLDRDGLMAYQEGGKDLGTPDQIIWVSTEDGLIRSAKGSVKNDARVVDKVRTNAVLARSDLAVHVPLRARMQYFRNTKPFTAATAAAALLSFGAFLLGIAFWRIRWILGRDKDDKDDEDHRDIRNATLRRYSVFAGSLTVLVIVILALSSLPKGGHPPLGLLVLIYSIPILGVLWLGMCFLVARHLVEMPRRAAHSQSRQQS